MPNSVRNIPSINWIIDEFSLNIFNVLLMSLIGVYYMPARRSTLDLILAVLKAIRDGCDKPTRIMYACNMSWKPMKRMLGGLVEKGYVLEIKHSSNRRSRKRYLISERGESVLRYFERGRVQFEVDII